jgi:hypothetical protein
LSDTESLLFITLETLPIPTPANFATSIIYVYNWKRFQTIY